jgi:acetyltransferase-like isoleucine patch superfamily enzyme
MEHVYKILMWIYKLFMYSMLAGILNKFSIKGNGVRISKGYKLRGFIYFDCHKTAQVTIGDKFVANSGFFYNHIGRQQTTSIIAKKGSVIQIGNNVGMSSCTLVAQKKISVGNNVRLGGNVVMYDSDFHSLNAAERTSVPEIKTNIRSMEIVIEDNVFIGAHATILKGSFIGENSIIGAGSVVSAHVPPNEIWGGNPAKFIRKIKNINEYSNAILGHS